MPEAVIEKRIGTGKPGPGRPKGSQNIQSIKAKEALDKAFRKAGGSAALARLAKSKDPQDRRTFWTLWGRAFVPQRVDVDTPEGGTFATLLREAAQVSPARVAEVRAELQREQAGRALSGAAS